MFRSCLKGEKTRLNAEGVYLGIPTLDTLENM